MKCNNCGTYLQPIFRFCPQCGTQNLEYVTLYPAKAIQNNNNLLYFQKLIVANSPNHLILTREQLIESSYPVVLRRLEICRESVDLINHTSNPTVFFSRWDILYEHSVFLLKVEPFIKFKPPTPSQNLINLCESENQSVKDFIDRFFYKTCEKANKLKTTNGKVNRLDGFIKSLTPYFNRISKDNYQYVITLYSKGISDIENNLPLNLSNRPKIKVVCKNYDVNSIAGIRQIPQNDFSVMQDLQKCATDHKRNGDLPLAIECLRKSNQISDYQSDPYAKLSQKEYIRIMNYTKLLNDSNAYAREESAIHRRHPEFWDKRISNRQRIQEEVEHNKSLQNDLVTIFSDKKCPICSQFKNIVFSISGNDWRYPKLPDIIINQTHNCTEHSMYLQPYFEDLEDLNQQYPDDLKASERREFEEMRQRKKNNGM